MAESMWMLCDRGSVCSPSESSSQLQEATMEQSLEAWPWGHDASSMSSPLSLHTSRPVRKATRTYTHAHTCKQTSPSPNTHFHTHIHILQTWTQIIFLFTSWAAQTNIHQPRKLRRNVRGASWPVFVLKRPVKKNPLVRWLMSVCVSPTPLIPSAPSPPLHPSLLSILGQQQIFIWWFTRGLCSPGCQQPRSFSAASRWFPGCTLPRFPPVEAAKNCSHTLSCFLGTEHAHLAVFVQRLYWKARQACWCSWKTLQLFLP